MQITFRNLRSSPELEQEIQRRTAKLEAVCPDVTGCRVLVELPHRHHRHGNRCRVRIDLDVPGSTVVVSHEPGGGLQRERDDGRICKSTEREPSHRAMVVAVRDAFVSAREQLQTYVDERRGAVKRRQPKLPPPADEDALEAPG